MHAPRAVQALSIAIFVLAMIVGIGGRFADVEASSAVSIALGIVAACLFVGAWIMAMREAILEMSGEEKDEALSALEQPQLVLAEVMDLPSKLPSEQVDRQAARTEHAARAGLHRFAAVAQLLFCGFAVIGFPIGMGVWWAREERDFALMFFVAWALALFLIVTEIVVRGRLRQLLAEVATELRGHRITGRDATTTELDWLDANGWGGAPFVSDVHTGGFRYVVTGSLRGTPVMLSVAHRSLFSFPRGGLRSGSDLVAAYISAAGGPPPQIAVDAPLQLTSSPTGLLLWAPSRRLRDVRALLGRLK